MTLSTNQHWIFVIAESLIQFILPRVPQGSSSCSMEKVQMTYASVIYDGSKTRHHIRPDRLGADGWAGWPALSHKHCSREPASSTSLSRKRTSNDTNQPTEQVETFNNSAYILELSLALTSLL